MTVRGPIAASDVGLALPHEHVLVDFGGADLSGPHRYGVEDVCRTMRRHLEGIVRLGVSTLFDCTPMYLGRDPRLLRRLSETVGVHIVTNTGQYQEPYLPASSLVAEADTLAKEWVYEFEFGIGDTGIRPGFVKTAVTPSPLAPVQRTITRAAAKTATETGLTIATHCGHAGAANEVLDLLEEEGVAAERWIFVHAQNEPDPDRLIETARRGCWIELDGIDESSIGRHLDLLVALIADGHESRVLLSHDGGWYRVGEKDPHPTRSYETLFTTFLPAARERGIAEETLTRIVAVNPAEAYRIRPQPSPDALS